MSLVQINAAPCAHFYLTMAHMNFPSKFRAAVALGAVTVCLSSASQAQPRLPRIGADIGYSYLLNSKARATFGSGVTDIGLGFGNITPSLEGKVGLDVSILRPRQNENGIKSDALVISAGPEYRKVFIPNSVKGKIEQQQQQQIPTGVIPPGTQMPGGGYGPPPILPYYGASVNLIYAQVDAPLENRNGNGFGVGGSVFAGVAFNDRFYLEGRVRATNQVEGFSFTRAGVTAGVRF